MTQQPLLNHKTCQHLHLEDLTLGRKQKYKATRCKDCGLILEITEA